MPLMHAYNRGAGIVQIYFEIDPGTQSVHTLVNTRANWDIFDNCSYVITIFSVLVYEND